MNVELLLTTEDLRPILSLLLLPSILYFLYFLRFISSDNVSAIVPLTQETVQFDDGTFITVNFNTNDQTLTQLLSGITWNMNVNGNIYNLTGSSTSLAQDINWAILQSKGLH